MIIGSLHDGCRYLLASSGFYFISVSYVFHHIFHMKGTFLFVFFIAFHIQTLYIDNINVVHFTFFNFTFYQDPVSCSVSRFYWAK